MKSGLLWAKVFEQWARSVRVCDGTEVYLSEAGAALVDAHQRKRMSFSVGTARHAAGQMLDDVAGGLDKRLGRCGRYSH